MCSKPDRPSSRGLPRRFAARGPAAELGRAFEDQKPKLYNLALRILENPYEAEEVVQETFLRVVEHQNSFKGESKLSTWIYRIALNECRQRIRKRQRARAATTEIARTLEHTEDAPKALARDETVAQVRRAVRGLPEPQREAVILAKYDGLPYAQIAEILGCSVGAVKARVFRGLENLRTRLRDIAPG